MTESPIPKFAREELAKHSKSFMGLGVVLIALGVLAIALPRISTFAVETFVGCLILFGGFAHLFHAFRPTRWQGFLLDVALGAVFVVAGALLLLFPLTGEMTLTLILSAAFAAEGILKIVAATQLRSQPGRGWVAFSGLMSLGLGIMIGVEWPSSSSWVIGLIVGIDLLFGGWTLVMLSVAARHNPDPSGSA
jgi:uncharacterized membrane protein HdeD (DUF308 family)